MLVGKRAHDAVYAASANAHACSYRVDALVVALYGHLCTLAGYAGDAADAYKTVCNLRNLCLQQLLQEHGARAAEENLRITILVVNAVNNSPHRVALVEEVAGNLLILWQEELISFVVEKQCLAFPSLIDIGNDDFALQILILII